MGLGVEVDVKVRSGDALGAAGGSDDAAEEEVCEAGEAPPRGVDAAAAMAEFEDGTDEEEGVCDTALDAAVAEELPSLVATPVFVDFGGGGAAESVTTDDDAFEASKTPPELTEFPTANLTAAAEGIAAGEEAADEAKAAPPTPPLFPPVDNV